MKTFLIMMFLLYAGNIHSQNIFEAFIKDTHDKNPLEGVTAIIKNSDYKTSSGKDGYIVFKNIPEGKYEISFKLIGYEENTLSVTIPAEKIYTIFLEEKSEETDEIIITSTRTSRTIDDEPTRVEVIEFEEIDEKSNMRPSNISMLLHESTGVLVQQNSAVSGNASIRLQGLDGRYTQLLKDGYPNYSNFSSNLSILEIPPLDLRQVELIKGPASTLYGGGAIAGVINFISKSYTEKNLYNLLYNQSSLGATDLSAFLSGMFGSTGYTLFSSYNTQRPADVDHDDFTELADSWYVNVSPKIFLNFDSDIKLSLSNNFSVQNRKGGDYTLIKNSGSGIHTYYENNYSLRNITLAEFEKILNSTSKLSFRQSFNYYNRDIELDDYTFKGDQYYSYSDLSIYKNIGYHDLILGMNFIFDDFIETGAFPSGTRDQNITTYSFYAQDNYDASDKLLFEFGLRLDYVNDYRLFVLPRISALMKFNNKFTSRISIGNGYKIPSLFTEDAEQIHYKNISGISNLDPELSYGGTADINFNSIIGDDFFFSLNQMFFYTYIKSPLILNYDSSEINYFSNASEPVRSMGFETNAKFVFKENYKLFLGYTFTEANADYLNPVTSMPLLPNNKLNLALIFEKHDFLKLGLEAYYSGSQILTFGNTAPPYWEFGFMIEKPFEYFSVYLNFENFTDTKQSNYKEVVSGPHNDPVFDDIWTHTEGFSINGGIKLKL